MLRSYAATDVPCILRWVPGLEQREPVYVCLSAYIHTSMSMCACMEQSRVCGWVCTHARMCTPQLECLRLYARMHSVYYEQRSRNSQCLGFACLLIACYICTAYLGLFCSFVWAGLWAKLDGSEYWSVCIDELHRLTNLWTMD
jgi:hypothetical protein